MRIKERLLLLLLLLLLNGIQDAMRVIFQRKLMHSGEIVQHTMQAMFSYTALISLKKLKYS